jgi:TetR/AcrR family transcriptional regulator, cholesterol catabolism regulator
MLRAMSAQATISRKEQILGAAASLFSERGYHATSMRDIGVASGMLHGSLYAHIRTKEDLLYEIVLRAAEKFLGGVEAAAGSPGSPEERLRAAMRAHVGVVAEDVDAARVFHHEWRALSGGRLQEVLALRDRYEDLWDVIVGALPGRRPRKLTRLLVLSAANWVYTWYDPAGPLTPDQVADGFTDLLLRGLRGGNGKGKDEVMA